MEYLMLIAQEWRTYSYLTWEYLRTQWRSRERILLTSKNKKKDTEVIAKGISAKGIQKDNMDAPMKTVAEDLQPAPSLQSRKHSKTNTSLEAFMVIHILHLTDFVLS